MPINNLAAMLPQTSRRLIIQIRTIVTLKLRIKAVKNNNSNNNKQKRKS